MAALKGRGEPALQYTSVLSIYSAEPPAFVVSGCAPCQGLHRFGWVQAEANPLIVY